MMNNKKAAFDLQTFVVTFVLFMGIMVTFGTIAVSMSNSYMPMTGDTVDDSFTNTYNKLDDIETSTQELKEKVVDTDTGTSDSSAEFLGDALNSLKLIGKSLSSVVVMFEDVATTIGMPSIWFRVLSAVVIIMLFTVVIFMIFRYR